jgi:hypothetical protein
MVGARISRARGAIWGVWAASARQRPAEPASAVRALRVAGPITDASSIGDVPSARPRAASSPPETGDLLTPTI